MWKYKLMLPVKKDVEPVSLGEGDTPLIPSKSHRRLFVKFEGANPTGSFKDRGMTLAVTIAKYIGARSVVVASTGNTSASAAAYAARAGLECLVYLPKGSVARGKLFQALLHGAKVVEVDGNFDEALEEVVARYVDKASGHVYPLNSVNPWRLEGQKTIAFEIYQQLGFVPDNVIVPVGNAGNIYAIWKGFRELREVGVTDRVPRMIGVQAEGASPVFKTWLAKADELVPVERPYTVATAIKIGRPVNWLKALTAVRESKGFMLSVSDAMIMEALKTLARNEGIGVEPASAAPLAGYRVAVEQGLIGRDETTVLIATGHALKDPEVRF